MTEQRHGKILICFKCGSEIGLESLQSDEWCCKDCHTYYKLSRATDAEMIEWFVN